MQQLHEKCTIKNENKKPKKKRKTEKRFEAFAHDKPQAVAAEDQLKLVPTRKRRQAFGSASASASEQASAARLSQQLFSAFAARPIAKMVK